MATFRRAFSIKKALGIALELRPLGPMAPISAGPCIQTFVLNRTAQPEWIAVVHVADAQDC